MSSHISEIIKAAAHEAGFDLAGVAAAGDSPELRKFPEWIDAGRAGEMKYLAARDEQGELRRGSLQRVAPWAKSVVVCAINYNSTPAYSTEFRDQTKGWISRYAWGREDYHDAVMRRLRRVEEAIKRSAESEPVTTWCYVDTGPLVERVFAKYAGIGWIGKNTCIINQKKGSWLFLGVILTSLGLIADLPAPDRCGSCTRCIDACPTDAILAPYQLDSNRCISYLTIEKRGEIAEELREGIGRHVFGCDICQDVCPWNRKAPAGAAEEFQPVPELVNPALAWLAGLSAEEFRRIFRKSPIRRTKWVGLRRNAALAMGNSGDASFLARLQELTNDEDASIRSAARWAVHKLQELL